MNNQGWECPRCHNILGPNAMYCIFCVGKNKEENEKKEGYSEESLKRIKNNIIKGDIANTITANAMQSANHNNCGLVIEPKIISHNIKQEVRVRKYPVDTVRLQELLRAAKDNMKYSNNHIAECLCVPVTTVEHWFRTDSSFAIPEPDLWLPLKTLLKITTDEFDKAIMTFETKSNVYEKADRVYDEEGIAPTLTQQVEKLPGAYGRNFGSKGKLQDTEGTCDTLQAAMGNGGGNVPIVEVNRKYGIFDNEKSTHQAGSVYDDNGLSPTLDTMEGGYRQPCVEVKNNQSDFRIRKLTPKECWRLMGFDDEDFEKAEKVNSNTQLYKQAGNSIVVDVLEGIFTNLLK